MYHPTNGGHAYAQVGWPGSIGALSGFSEAQLGISEIGAYYADDSFGQGTANTPPEKVHGKPWMFVLRDVLQYSDSLEQAVSDIQNSNRTCNLIIGVGDGEENMVNGIEYSGYVAVPYNDSTLLPVNETWHAPIKDVVYNGMSFFETNYCDSLCLVIVIVANVCIPHRRHGLAVSWIQPGARRTAEQIPWQH